MDTYERIVEEGEFPISACTFGVVKTRHKRLGQVAVGPQEYMVVCKRYGRDDAQYYNMWLTQTRFGFENPYTKVFKSGEDSGHLKAI